MVVDVGVGVTTGFTTKLTYTGNPTVQSVVADWIKTAFPDGVPKGGTPT